MPARKAVATFIANWEENLKLRMSKDRDFSQYQNGTSGSQPTWSFSNFYLSKKVYGIGLALGFEQF